MAGAMLELSRGFSSFADECVRFSREMAKAAGLPNSLGLEENVRSNLRIARTIFGKWSIDILALLYSHRGGIGFQEVRRSLHPISPRVLSSKLKQMEEQGLVRRHIVPSRPPRVLYSLTEKGLMVAQLGEPVFLYLRFTEGLLGAGRVGEGGLESPVGT